MEPQFYESLIHPQDRARYRALRASLPVRRNGSARYRLRHGDGRYGWVHEFVRCACDETGQPREQIACLIEAEPKVLSRKLRAHAVGLLAEAVASRARLLARRSRVLPKESDEDRLYYALNGANDGLWDWNLVTDSVYYSPRWKEMLGYADDELENHLDTWKRLVIPEDREATLQVVARFIQSQEKIFELEFRVRHKAGHLVHGLARGMMIRDAQGRPRRLVGTLVDVTSWRKTEEALREKESILRAFFESSGLMRGIVEVVGDDLKHVVANQVAARSLGRAVDTLPSQLASELGASAKNTNLWIEQFENCRRAGGFVEFDFSRPVNGDTRHLRCVVSHLGPGTDGPRFSYVISDVTAHKMAREALRESRNELERRVQARTAELQAAQARLELLVQTVPAGIVIHGPDGRIVRSNPAARQMLGLAELDAAGRPPEKFAGCLLREDGSVMPLSEFPVSQVLTRRTRVSGQIVGLQRSGQGDLLWAYVNAEPKFDDRGQIEEVVVGFMNITERMRAEAALNDSVHFTRGLIACMQDGFSVLDTQGVARDANPAFCQMTGFTREELVGVAPPHPYWPPEEYARIQTALGQTLAGDSTDFELTFMRKNGERFPVIVSPFAVKNGAGETVCYSATVKDVTKRKQAEAALRESEERLRLALHASNAGVWAWDPLTGAVYWDECMSQIYGCGPNDQPSFDTWIGCMHPEDRAGILKRVEEFLQPGSPNDWDTEFRVLHPTLGERWINGLARAERDAQGRLVSLVGINLDITDRKRIEIKLRESEAKHRNLIEGMMDAYATVDLQGRILQANSMFADMVGYSEAELQQMTYMELTPPKWHAAEAGILREQVLTRGYSDVYEKEYRRKDGSTFPIELRASLLRNSAGEPVAMWGIMRDVSERKRLEAELRQLNHTLEERVAQRTVELRESEARFRQLAESTFEGIVISEAGAIIDCNTQCATMFGYDRADVLGRNLLEFVGSEFREQVGLQLQTGATASYEVNAVRKDGVTFPVEVHAREMTKDGRRLRMTALRDLTAARQAAAEMERKQQDLSRAQRLAEVSQITMGVIHQIGQPLSAVMANISAVKTRVARCGGPNCGSHEALVEVDADLKSVRETIERIQALAHPERPRRRPASLNDLITKLLDWLRPDVQVRQIQLQTEFAPDLPPVSLDEIQIKQAIINVLRNAFDAVASCEDIRRIVIISTRADAGWVELNVSDRGAGISPAAMASLFSPFFTTKPDGMGVGLPLAHTILRAHGGRVEAFNNDGPGATFRILIPIGKEGV